tara:strand:- start:2463 stop:2651 length:189 start_codon:yes stop_codon:yes gene_type:complete
MQFKYLTKLLEDYIEIHQLQLISPKELITLDSLTDEEYEWMRNFTKAWEAAEDLQFHLDKLG